MEGLIDHGATHLEIERKFLLNGIPNLGVPGITVISIFSIEQTYTLPGEDRKAWRLRKRVHGQTVEWYKTYKRKIGKSQQVRKEEDHSISEEEYTSIMKQKDPEFGVVRKTRTVFVYRGQKFELDVFADGLVILEIELPTIGEDVFLPDCVKSVLVREVTEEDAFYNKEIARRIAKGA